MKKLFDKILDALIYITLIIFVVSICVILLTVAYRGFYLTFIDQCSYFFR
jgi:hypothetical protein